ncbi:MAG: amino acid adenylation domain-containing protein [Polyangiaceae bacterium]|jgi:amino acid adenylation domain-containing protein
MSGLNTEAIDIDATLSSELLAVLLEEEGWRGAGEAGIPRRSEARPVLSLAQTRLWFLTELEPQSCAYNIVLSVRLEGSVDVAALRYSLERIVGRHEVLRTRIGSANGLPTVDVERDVELKLRQVDLGPLGPEDASKALQSVREEEARQPIDLTSPPPLRATLVRCHPEQHVLILVVHHIAFDGWSARVLVSELGAIYTARCAGVDAVLPALPVQYGDFAEWQERFVSGDRLDALVRYWKAQLANPAPPIELPFDRPRAGTRTGRAALLPIEVGGETLRRIKGVCREAGTGLLAGLGAVLALLLARCGGSDDIVIGCPVAGRTRSELEPLIGFFVNTVPLRIRVDGQCTFRELVGRAGAVVEGALAHQDLPFDKIAEAVRPDRSLGHNPIFQVLLAVQSGLVEPFTIPGVAVSADPYQRTCRFDLELHVWEVDGVLRGAIYYSPELFNPETIERLYRRWVTLLGAAAARPASSVRTLAWLPDDERAQILRHSRGPRLPDPGIRLHAAVQAQARRTPDRVAIRSLEGQFTYRALDRVADAIAHRLREMHGECEAHVGILCVPSFAMWACVLGVLKAGYAYVPLDPEHPPLRRAAVARGVRLHTLIADSDLTGGVPGYEGSVLVAEEVCRGDAARRPSRPIARERLFCVLHTSGSTGTPKGVGLTHGIVEDMVARYVRRPERETAQFAPLGFDVSLEETFPTWSVGGSVTLIPRDVRRDVPALARFLVARRIEKAILSATWWKQLVQVPVAPREYAFVELIATGEQLQVTPAMRTWFRAQPAATLRNVYGPTEAQVVTDDLLPADPELWEDLPPIGAPLPTCSAFVLDRWGEVLPARIHGELWAANETPSRGYVGQPAMTAERFVPNPFGDPGTRVYRTGDVVRWRDDGRLDYLGRSDRQVKIRGFRVETGEVEAVLARHAGVREVAVVERPDPTGSLQLVAVVASRSVRPPSPSELAEHLRPLLPDYMLPARILVLDCLPTVPNGKLDREALRRWIDEETSRAAAPTGEAPRTPMEALIAATWGEVLGRRGIVSGDSFFALGGHSLAATQVVARLGAALGREVPVRLVFEHPVLGALAEALTRLAGDAPIEREEFDL